MRVAGIIDLNAAVISLFDAPAATLAEEPTPVRTIYTTAFFTG